MLAERAIALGDNVVATARSIQTLHDLERGHPKQVLRMTLDVRDDAQVDSAAAAAVERFGRIDVLVNNAGYGYFATAEQADLTEVRDMYDTNVFGLMSMTQAVLPTLREQQGGTIVNLSSIAGRIGSPRGGFYQSTKWAVEAFSEALYLEAVSFGIRMIIVEPGAYETDFASRSARTSPLDAEPDSPYAGLRAQWMANASAAIFPRRQDPVEVIDGIIDAVNSDLPFIRLPLGHDATRLVALREELGDTAFVEWMRRTYYGE